MISLIGLLQELCSILMASGVPADVLTEVRIFVYLHNYCNRVKVLQISGRQKNHEKQK